MDAYIILIYGILAAAGGVMGYVKSKSTPSLLSGLLFGILLVGSSVLMMNGDARGAYFALVLSSVLLAIFLFRFRASKKFMPAGVMIFLSLIAVATLLFGLFLA